MNRKTSELNRLNNQLDAKINAENQAAFTDMICYLRAANISEYDQEAVRRDLTEMVISAQERGEGIDSVIGGDYKAFCDEVIANLPKKTAKENALDVLDILCWGLSIMLLISIVTSRGTAALVKAFATGGAVDFNIPFSVGSAVTTVLVLAAAVLIVLYITKNSFKLTRHKKSTALAAGLVGGGIMAAFILIAYFGSSTLFSMNIFIALAITAALYAAHRMLDML